MKVSKVLLAFALVLAIIISVSHVFAQETPKAEMKCEKRFMKMDSDKDGKITLNEFMAIKHPGGKAEELFKVRDANNDGVLTKEEFCSGKGGMKGKGKQKN